MPPVDHHASASFNSMNDDSHEYPLLQEKEDPTNYCTCENKLKQLRSSESVRKQKTSKS